MIQDCLTGTRGLTLPGSGCKPLFSVRQFHNPRDLFFLRSRRSVFNCMSSNRLTDDKYELITKRNWIAECQSLSPDRSLRLPTFSSSWESLTVLYLLSHIERVYWLTDDIHRRIAEMAYRYNYEGGWRNVQIALERYCQTPKEFHDWAMTIMSEEEFFGNIVRPARRLAEHIDFRLRDPHGPVRRPQRHRGYKDKGTYVPPHRRYRHLPSDETDERIDRRKNVGHPLLKENLDGG